MYIYIIYSLKEVLKYCYWRYTLLSSQWAGGWSENYSISEGYA